MSLTDDWKVGKLNGCFWCKYPDGHTEAHQLNNLRHESYMDIEVLAPCDYEELQRLKTENEQLKTDLPLCYRCKKFSNIQKNIDKTYKNQQRKINHLYKLLRKCSAWMIWAYAELYEYDSEHKSKYTENLINRIGAAICGSEEQ